MPDLYPLCRCEDLLQLALDICRSAKRIEKHNEQSAQRLIGEALEAVNLASGQLLVLSQIDIDDS